MKSTARYAKRSRIAVATQQCSTGSRAQMASSLPSPTIRLVELQDPQRLKQVGADHLVIDIELHKENVVLPQVDRAKCHDATEQNPTFTLAKIGREQPELRKGKEAQRHVPHVRVTQVHAVFDVAHHQ